MRVLVVGDDNFTFTPCIIANLDQWKSKVRVANKQSSSAIAAVQSQSVATGSRRSGTAVNQRAFHNAADTNLEGAAKSEGDDTALSSTQPGTSAAPSNAAVMGRGGDEDSASAAAATPDNDDSLAPKTEASESAGMTDEGDSPAVVPASAGGNSPSSSDEDEPWQFEVASCLAQDKVPSEFLANLQALQALRVKVHFSVNPALLRQYFPAQGGGTNKAGSDTTTPAAKEHTPADEPPCGPPYDIVLFILPGLEFEGCPSYIDKASELYRLRLHLFWFALVRSTSVIARPGGRLFFLWVEQPATLPPIGPAGGQPTGKGGTAGNQRASSARGNVAPTTNNQQMPFPFVEIFKVGPFCKICRAADEDFRLNLSWGDYKTKWKPVLHNAELLHFPRYLEALKVYCFRNIPYNPATERQTQQQGNAGHSNTRQEDFNLLRIPHSICQWDRSVLPHVNELFHFNLRTCVPGEVVQISKLSVKYDPRITGWRNSGHLSRDLCPTSDGGAANSQHHQQHHHPAGQGPPPHPNMSASPSGLPHHHPIAGPPQHQHSSRLQPPGGGMLPPHPMYPPAGGHRLSVPPPVAGGAKLPSGSHMLPPQPMPYGRSATAIPPTGMERRGSHHPGSAWPPCSTQGPMSARNMPAPNPAAYGVLRGQSVYPSAGAGAGGHQGANTGIPGVHHGSSTGGGPLASAVQPPTYVAGLPSEESMPAYETGWATSTSTYWNPSAAAVGLPPGAAVAQSAAAYGQQSRGSFDYSAWHAGAEYYASGAYGVPDPAYCGGGTSSGYYPTPHPPPHPMQYGGSGARGNTAADYARGMAATGSDMAAVDDLGGTRRDGERQRGNPEAGWCLRREGERYYTARGGCGPRRRPGGGERVVAHSTVTQRRDENGGRTLSPPPLRTVGVPRGHRNYGGEGGRSSAPGALSPNRLLDGEGRRRQPPGRTTRTVACGGTVAQIRDSPRRSATPRTEWGSYSAPPGATTGKLHSDTVIQTVE